MATRRLLRSAGHPRFPASQTARRERLWALAVVDTLTHAVIGALGARTLIAQRLPRRWSLAAGALGGLFPDIDYLWFLLDPLQFHAYWHRSFTHSLLMLPLWALLLSVTLYLLGGRKQNGWLLYLGCALGLGLHIAADLITAWDLQLFWPLSDWRTSLAWIFVIDPWFSALALTALLLCWRWPHAGWLGAAPLVLWLIWSIQYKQQALELAQAFAQQQAEAAQVSVWPQPFSPRNWKLLVSGTHGHWQAHLRLGDSRSRLADYWPHPWLRSTAQAYQPHSALIWQFHPRFDSPQGDGETALQLWHSEMLQDVRQFFSAPARYHQPDSSASHCLWFTDLIYSLPTQRPPFIYGACRSPSSFWQLSRQPVTATSAE
ncbi:hypothetical protein CK507_06940 [Pseudomonas sp. WN033]|nr:hypothetical protein CK507_06940 [Pseudomonas sp. WN033]